jgi:hypothetical protein
LVFGEAAVSHGLAGHYVEQWNSVVVEAEEEEFGPRMNTDAHG